MCPVRVHARTRTGPHCAYQIVHFPVLLSRYTFKRTGEPELVAKGLSNPITH